jgi:WD40 repeat protein
MRDLEERMRGIDHLAVPDLLDRARMRALDHRPAIQPSPARRVAIIAAAFAVSAIALWMLRVAFLPDSDEQPPVSPPVSTRNGDIWVLVGRKDWREIAIYRVDPENMGEAEAMWTNSPEVFTGARNAPELVATDYDFSPDGTRVAFSRRVEPSTWRGPRELFVMNVDGTGLQQLTHDGQYATSPAWSPDGNTIAYTRTNRALNPTDIYVISASGGAPTPLAADPTVNEMSPSWSPDGNRIAFEFFVFGGENRIASMRSDGSDRVELVSGHAPAWSPDGTSIAFYRLLDRTTSIWTIAPDGSEGRKIVDAGNPYLYYRDMGGPLWSPDGASIAFARSLAGAMSLWLVDPSGDTSPHRVAGWHGFEGYLASWRPVPAPSSSPTASSAS